MKYLDNNYYVEVKDHRYRIHPNENIILGLRDEPKSLRTQYQVQNETQIRRNQKVIKNDNDQLVVKNYPKNKNKQPIIQQKLPNCPSCKINNWLEFDRGYYCKNCEYIINKQKHQIDKKVHRQEVKDHRYKIHPTENIILRKRDPPLSPRTQYQVQNETQIRRNQKVVKLIMMN